MPSNDAGIDPKAKPGVILHVGRLVAGLAALLLVGCSGTPDTGAVSSTTTTVPMTAPSTTETAPGSPPPTTAPATATVEVAVLCRGIDVDAPRDRICASRRPAPGSVGVLANALGQLFAGPTKSETSGGLRSYFTPDTAELLRSVDLDGGTATVDLDGEVLTSINGVGTTNGSGEFLAQLLGTVFQFPTIDEVVFLVDGDATKFCRALEASEDCNPWTRTKWERR